MVTLVWQGYHTVLLSNQTKFGEMLSPCYPYYLGTNSGKPPYRQFGSHLGWTSETWKPGVMDRDIREVFTVPSNQNIYRTCLWVDFCIRWKEDGICSKVSKYTFKVNNSILFKEPKLWVDKYPCHDFEMENSNPNIWILTHICLVDQSIINWTNPFPI